MAQDGAPIGVDGVTAISSLLAIAMVRRLLIELQVPEDPVEASPIAPNLSTWVSQPLSDLGGGLTPAELLATPLGLERLRNRLAKTLAVSRAAARS